MENIVLDSVDLKILRLVQGDAGLSIAELAERVGLSQNLQFGFWVKSYLQHIVAAHPVGLF